MSHFDLDTLNPLLFSDNRFDGTGDVQAENEGPTESLFRRMENRESMKPKIFKCCIEIARPLTEY